MPTTTTPIDTLYTAASQLDRAIRDRDAEIAALRADAMLVRRKNASHRALIKDCVAALAGDATCRDRVAAVWTRRSFNEQLAEIVADAHARVARDRASASRAARRTADRASRAARHPEPSADLHQLQLHGPERAFKLTPGWEAVYVNTRDPAGKPRDADAAARFLAERPYAHLLVYKGTARHKFHVFEYNPEDLRK